MIESYFPRGCGLHRFLMKYHVFGFPSAFWAFWPKHFDFIQNIPESSFLHTFYIGGLVSTIWFFSAFQFFLIFFEYSQQKYSRIFIFTYVLHRGLGRHILICLNIFNLFSSFLRILNRNIPESSFLHTFYIGDLIGVFWFVSAFSICSHLFWRLSTEIFQNLHFYIRFI